MDDNSTSTTDVDVEDVSLVDTPLDAPLDKPSEPAEPAKDDGAATTDKPEEKPSEAKEAEATEEGKPADPQTEEAEPEKGKPDPDKARQAFQQRQQTRQQITKQLDDNYAPKSEDDLVNEGLDAQEAKIQALREEMLFRDQRAQIAEMNAGLQADAVNVLQDFDIYNPKSESYDADFTEQVQKAYQVAARLQTDDNGIVLNAEVPLYDFHKQMADIYSRGLNKGSTQKQTETLEMLAKTDDVVGGSSTGTRGNSLEELEERLGDVSIV